MKLTSPAFENNKNIPSKYTCDGDNINPPLEIRDIPKGTKTFVLIMDDPDAPAGTWSHWVVWNIKENIIEENTVPGIQGMNSFGKKEYGGPCPSSGTHHYRFKLYALNTTLGISEGNKGDVERAMQDHVLGHAELMGLYSHQ